MFAVATMDRVVGVADDLRSIGGAGGVVFIVVYVTVRHGRDGGVGREAGAWHGRGRSRCQRYDEILVAVVTNRY
jgi:hypothetical protein